MRRFKVAGRNTGIGGGVSGRSPTVTGDGGRHGGNKGGGEDRSISFQ
jgi:hypothetical protein